MAHQGIPPSAANADDVSEREHFVEPAFQQRDIGQIDEGRIVLPDDLPLPPAEMVHLFKLRQTDGGIQVGHVVTKSVRDRLVKPAALVLAATPAIAVDAQDAPGNHALGQDVVVGRHCPAFAAGDVLDRVEAETRQVADVADFADVAEAPDVREAPDVGEAPDIGQVADIAQAEGIPKKFLEAILLTLKNNGMLSSRKGPGGGYSLAKAPSAITITLGMLSKNLFRSSWSARISAIGLASR